MHERYDVLTQAEAIAREAKHEEIDQLAAECERSDDRTLRSLANVYRRLRFGF